MASDWTVPLSREAKAGPLALSKCSCSCEDLRGQGALPTHLLPLGPGAEQRLAIEGPGS